MEREASMEEVAANGIRLDAKVSAPLLGSIFYEQNPLNDGAAIIRGDTLVAAACRLPLSESPTLAQNLHMRHRAAIGVTEGQDCLAIVVSEERGLISLASDGALKQVNPQDLREALYREMRGFSSSARVARTRRVAVGTKGGTP
jgi:diadenylate cyclase